MTSQSKEELMARVLEWTPKSVFIDTGSAEDFSFSKALANFVHLEIPEEEACVHWSHIVETLEQFKKSLGRTVSIHTAITDYFTGPAQILDSPILIDLPVFKQTVQIAMVDSLTGLFNRRYMDIVLKKEFNRCERYSKAFSVCIIDIDNFKNINDTFGHQYGDKVLKELSALIRSTVREEDIACRYGGEEFLVILPETDENGAFRLANRIRNVVKNNRFFRDQKITFSAGTATYPSAARETEELVKAADRALYQAKYSGKDRVVAALPERRRFGRFSKNWELTIFTNPEGEPVSGIMTQNVSLGGVQFECPINFTVDTLLSLVFTNSESDVPHITTDGKITWVKKKNGNYVYGVSLNETPELYTLRLEEISAEVSEVV